jgi:hypothetical protein
VIRRNTQWFLNWAQRFLNLKRKLLESKPRDLEIRRTGLEAQTPHPETFQINFRVKNWNWRLS